MGLRHDVCHCLFWTKAFIALFLAVISLAFYSWVIIDMHLIAADQMAKSSQPVNAPIVIPGGVTTGTVAGGATITATIPSNGDALAACDSTRSGRARLQPPNNLMMFGLSLDWAAMTPTQAVNILGYNPGVFNTFMEMDMNLTPPYDNSSLNWFGSEVGRVGGILELTMAPTSPLTGLTDEVLDALAQQCRDINSRYGVPILLRFGHEMNGDWTAYGYKPVEYKAAFIRMTSFIRKYTNVTAMVWAPNIGIAYPFTASVGNSGPPTTGQNLLALDTNGNGVVDAGDDPYGPYYPGDAYVDWVGLSLYYYPFTNDNVATPPTYFNDEMVGSGPTVENTVAPENLNQQFYDLHNFYKRFAAGKNKPMLLPETGAPFLSNVAANAGEVNIKMGWWNQVLNKSTFQTFPLLQLAVNFEETKLLNSFQRDWRLLHNPSVLSAFRPLLTTFDPNLIQGNKMTFGCDGSISLK